MSTASSVARTVSHLRAAIAYHENAYRTRLAPEISDEEFNALKTQLHNLLSDHPQLELFSDRAIGNDTVGDRPMVVHDYPMLSLEYVTSIPALCTWMDRCSEGTLLSWMVSQKLDGLALSLDYLDGYLIRAARRGDGVAGEDVTDLAASVVGIPAHCPAMPKGKVTVRGEVVVTRGDFEAYHLTRPSHARIYSGPRAMAAAAMRFADPKNTAMLKPTFIAYRLILPDGHPCYADHAFNPMTYLEGFGFKVVEHIVVNSVPMVLKAVAAIQEDRQQLPYQIDGAVISAASRAVQQRLGDTREAPRWAMAFKYPSMEATTTAVSIEYSVGRTGIVTPILKLEPVVIGDITVRSVTLHNARLMEMYRLSAGDKVIVRRANDIGPQYVRSMPSDQGTRFVMPVRCPSCQTPLLTSEADPYCRCPNVTTCPAQRLGTFLNLCGNRALDIDGLGQHRMKSLIDAGLLKEPADLFQLTARQLKKTLGVSIKVADDLVQAIAVARWTTLPRLITGLGIDGIGTRVASTLCKAFGYSLEALLDASVEALTKVDGIGSTRAFAVYQYMQANRASLLRLIDYGLRWHREAPRPKETPGPLEGQRLVVTGRIVSQRAECLPREAIENFLIEHGAHLMTQLGTRTSALLIGDRPSPSKMATAASLGLPVLSFAEYLSDHGIAHP